MILNTQFQLNLWLATLPWSGLQLSCLAQNIIRDRYVWCAMSGSLAVEAGRDEFRPDTAVTAIMQRLEPVCVSAILWLGHDVFDQVGNSTTFRDLAKNSLCL